MNTTHTTFIGKSDSAEQCAAPQVLLIGIGNEFRRDDAVGILTARIIKERKLPYVKVLEASGEGTEAMEAWKDAGTVVLVDTISSRGKPGAICRIDLLRTSIPKSMAFFSTHAFGVAQAVELARSLKSLPTKMILFGVEGSDFSPGLVPSPEMQAAMIMLEELLVHELTSLVAPAELTIQG